MANIVLLSPQSEAYQWLECYLKNNNHQLFLCDDFKNLAILDADLLIIDAYDIEETQSQILSVLSKRKALKILLYTSLEMSEFKFKSKKQITHVEKKGSAPALVSAIEKMFEPPRLVLVLNSEIPRLFQSGAISQSGYFISRINCEDARSLISENNKNTVIYFKSDDFCEFQLAGLFNALKISSEDLKFQNEPSKNDRYLFIPDCESDIPKHEFWYFNRLS